MCSLRVQVASGNVLQILNFSCYDMCFYWNIKCWTPYLKYVVAREGLILQIESHAFWALDSFFYNTIRISPGFFPSNYKYALSTLTWFIQNFTARNLICVNITHGCCITGWNSTVVSFATVHNDAFSCYVPGWEGQYLFQIIMKPKTSSTHILYLVYVFCTYYLYHL